MADLNDDSVDKLAEKTEALSGEIFVSLFLFDFFDVMFLC